jgi:hypothetical protein
VAHELPEKHRQETKTRRLENGRQSRAAARKTREAPK